MINSILTRFGVPLRVKMELIITALIFCTLTSCGFQVIYREADAETKTSYEQELATIRIQKDSGRLTQELRNALKDTFNPDYIEAEPKYILVVNMGRSVGGTFITATGASGRNRVTLTIDYQMKDAKTGKIVSIGSTVVNDNYDVQTNRYGTYVAEDYARSNLVKIAALNIRNLLVNDLIELKKNGDQERDEPLTNGVYTDEATKEKQKKIAADTSCTGADLDLPPTLKTP